MKVPGTFTLPNLFVDFVDGVPSPSFEEMSRALQDLATPGHTRWGVGYVYDPISLAAHDAARKEAEMKPITDTLNAIQSLNALHWIPLARREELIRERLERLATDSYDEGHNDGVEQTKERLLGVFDD